MIYMKLLCIIFAILSIYKLDAQEASNQSDINRLKFSVIVENNSNEIPLSSVALLSNKILNFINDNYLGSLDKYNRFIILATIDIVTKEIISSAPIMEAYVINLNLYLGDGIDGTLFSSTSITLRGVGTNTTKAISTALKNFDGKNQSLLSFMQNGSNKIIDYYMKNCDIIINKALSNSDIRNYDLALYQLSEIPSVCIECYEKAATHMTDIYNKRMEEECLLKILEAKSLMAKNEYQLAADCLNGIFSSLECYGQVENLLAEINIHQCNEALGKARGYFSSNNFEEASYWLGQISADSECASDAVILGNEIRNYLLSKENREWNFELKKQQDQVNITLSGIEAARAVGIAYGENQPRSITYNYGSWVR